MTALEAVQSVQFITVKDKRLAVLDATEWEALIDWIEMLEDSQIVKSAFSKLSQAGGNREKAGWLRWEDVRDEIL